LSMEKQKGAGVGTVNLRAAKKRGNWDVYLEQPKQKMLGWSIKA